MKKLLSILLILSMLVCMIPAVSLSASAENVEIKPDTSWYDKNTLATGNKYYIYDAADLLGFSYLLNPNNSSTGTANTRPFGGSYEEEVRVFDVEFHIMNDIDLNPGWDASKGTEPANAWKLASTCQFASKIYGHGHTIKGIYFKTTSGSRGIFGEVIGRNAEIRDLTIENSYYESTGNNSGFLFGNVKSSPNTLTIENVCIKATLKHEYNGSGYIGGFIGWNDSSGNNTAKINIINSVFDGSINANYTGSGNVGIGGFIAGNNSSSTSLSIQNSASYVTVSGSGASGNNVFVGGFVGLSFNGKISVSNSVSKLTMDSEWSCAGKNNNGGVAGVFRYPSTGVVNMLALSNVYYSGVTVAVPEMFKQGTENYEASGNDYNTVVGSLATTAATDDLITAVNGWDGWTTQCADGKPLPTPVAANLSVTNTTVAGYQAADAENGAFRFRIIGVLDLGDKQLEDYAEVGFKATVTKGSASNDKEYGTTMVYSSVDGNTDTGLVTYTAEELGGDYIFVMPGQFPEPAKGETITVTVQSYYKLKGDDTAFYSETYTLTVAPPKDHVN